MAPPPAPTNRPEPIHSQSELWSPRSQRHGLMSKPMVASPAHHMTDEEVEAMIQNFSQLDTTQEKTWTRIAVERFLSKYKWYFPRRDATHRGSLSKAYAYYEHVTLPRRYVGEQNAEHLQRRAEPGETEPTELYSPWSTPPSAFIEWGVGIDLYFSTLRMMSFVLFVAGLINLPNIIFYSGDSYSPQGRTGVSWTLDTSAVCSSGEWVVCSDCHSDQFQNGEEQDRFRIALDGTTKLVLRNDCNGGQLPQGMVNFATGVFLLIMISLISLYLLAREVRADEDKVTATDYSVVVRNPPPDAYDPDEWHAFFSQFADKQVTVITVALNNELLLRKLVARRRHMRSLRMMLPRGVDLEDEDMTRAAVAQLLRDQEIDPPGCLIRFLDCLVFPFLRPFGMFLKPDALVNNIFQLRREIDELQQQEYEVCTVYVTFETEEGQRAALSALSTGKLNTMSNNTAACAPGSVFQGRLLSVDQPTEPSSVRWLDLSASSFSKLTWRVVNFVITCGVIALAGLCVGKVRTNLGAGYAGPLISVFNSAIPLFVKILMIFEKHVSEGSFQTSLYLKITLFRWVNTAILVKLLTPFTSTVSPGPKDVLVQVNAIMWSELWLTPGIRLLDLMGNIKKHILAPRAMNQETMNLSFQGTPYNIAERYTDLTKVLFVVFFYSALFPSCFFFGWAILTVQYYADKFCLMRIWGPAPSIGSELASFSRRYFFSGAMLAFVLVSAYAWAQFPYDNLCDPDEGRRTYGVAGAYEYRDKSGAISTTTVAQDWKVEYCCQSWLCSDGFPFPPTSRLQPPGTTWMDESQETLTGIYGWTSVLALIAFVLIFFGSAITRFLLSWFQGVYKPQGQNQHIDFSSDPDIDAYVPQVRAGGFPFPFLACDVEGLDESLIGWKDPSHPFDYHNLIFDVPWEGMPRRKKPTDPVGPNAASNDGNGGAKKRKPIYSIVKHYPPDWKVKLANAAAAASGTAAL